MNYNNGDLVMSFFSSFKIRSPPSSPISGYTYNNFSLFSFFFRENRFDLFVLYIYLISYFSKYMEKMSPYDMGGGLNIPDQVLVINCLRFQIETDETKMYSYIYCVPFLQGEGKMQCKNFYFSFLEEPNTIYRIYVFYIVIQYFWFSYSVHKYIHK